MLAIQHSTYAAQFSFLKKRTNKQKQKNAHNTKTEKQKSKNNQPKLLVIWLEKKTPHALLMFAETVVGLIYYNEVKSYL